MIAPKELNSLAWQPPTHLAPVSLSGRPRFLRLIFGGFGGLLSFISECGFGGIRKTAPISSTAFSFFVSVTLQRLHAAQELADVTECGARQGNKTILGEIK